MRSDLIDPAINAHDGRIVKWTGDGALIEFRSVVYAVRCAVEVQNGMAERNAGLPPQRRIDFDPVRAFSLQIGLPPTAKPRPPVRGKRPALRLAGVAIAAALAMVPDWRPWSTPKPDVLDAALYDKLATAPRLFIVVLPFESLASDPDQQNFADAFTDDLTAEVSQLKDSFVIGRDSASPYKERPVDARKIGGGLGVRYLLEGSASRVAGAVRVSAQLISTETGRRFGRTGLRARPRRSAKCRRTSSLASPICSARKSLRLKAGRRCANSL